MKKVKEIIKNKENDSLKLKPKGRGGVRKNSGRKKGKMEQKTIDKINAEKEMKQKILKSLEPILNAQLSLAKGVQYLYRIDTEEDAKGNERRQKPVLVTDKYEIESYLAGNCDEDSYYFITTEKPDNRALDSLIDRVFGKSRQNIGLDGGEEGKPIEHKITSILDKIQDGNR